LPSCTRHDRVESDAGRAARSGISSRATNRLPCLTAMYEGLKPCPHRTVDDSGRILCGLIKGGDREVSVNLCRACPVPQINCQHLRAAMQKRVSTPITVRYATGRVEVWDDEAPTVGFKQAACAVKTMPIHSARDCSGCPLRAPHAVPQNAIQVARRAKYAPSADAPASSLAVAAGRRAIPPSIVAETPAQPAMSASEATREIVRRTQAFALQESTKRVQGVSSSRAARSERTGRGETKSKIILLQQWLADQFNKKNAEPKRPVPGPDEDGVQDIVYTPITTVYQEEPGYERCVGWTD
jgi:hypothetical protein